LTQRERGEEERGEKKRQRILAEINQARELKKHETQSEMNSGTTSEPHQTNSVDGSTSTEMEDIRGYIAERTLSGSSVDTETIEGAVITHTDKNEMIGYLKEVKEEIEEEEEEELEEPEITNVSEYTEYTHGSSNEDSKVYSMSSQSSNLFEGNGGSLSEGDVSISSCDEEDEGQTAFSASKLSLQPPLPHLPLSFDERDPFKDGST
ncbi:hypothetical protein ADUPG1_001921, partial [Aduncisulcus paluster]